MRFSNRKNAIPLVLTLMSNSSQISLKSWTLVGTSRIPVNTLHSDRVHVCSTRTYKGAGTIHFFPTRPDLIDRLNRVVGRRNRWLPPMDDMAPQAFWDAYDGCDKFDKELRDEVGKTRRAWWDNPFDNLHSNEKRLSAEDTILDAMEKVFERNGIVVGNLLADPTPAHPQLELLAA